MSDNPTVRIDFLNTGSALVLCHGLLVLCQRAEDGEFHEPTQVSDEIRRLLAELTDGYEAVKPAGNGGPKV